MLQLGIRKSVDKWLGKSQLIITAVVMAFGACLRAKPSDFQDLKLLANTLEWMQTWAWLVVFFGPPLVGAIQLVRRRYGNPWAWSAIQEWLDAVQEDVFRDIGPTDPMDHHRVTLFRYRRWLPGLRAPSTWGHWLVAVARSGHLTRSRIQKFRVPDDGESCEGVAGMAWRCRDWVFVPEPKQSPIPIPTSDSEREKIAEYAASTGVTHEWVQKKVNGKREMAASYAALKVLLHGKPWGVLVVDSRKAEGISSRKASSVGGTLGLLRPLLERA